MTNTPISDLRTELEEIINWTCYRSKQSPDAIDKAVNRIAHLLQDHIDKAMIDELEELKEDPSWFTDTAPFEGERVKYVSVEEIEERIAELSSNKEEKS